MAAPPDGPVPCALCGRLLREAESRRLRLGRVCRKRLAGRTGARPRRTGTITAAPHPRAVPARAPTQLALELWDDDPEPDEPHPHIIDVPTGALL